VAEGRAREHLHSEKVRPDIRPQLRELFAGYAEVLARVEAGAVVAQENKSASRKRRQPWLTFSISLTPARTSPPVRRGTGALLSPSTYRPPFSLSFTCSPQLLTARPCARVKAPPTSDVPRITWASLRTSRGREQVRQRVALPPKRDSDPLCRAS